MPWVENAKQQRGLKGRQRFFLEAESARCDQVLAALQAAGLWGSVDPGHRPSASALGWILPALWAGFC